MNFLETITKVKAWWTYREMSIANKSDEVVRSHEQLMQSVRRLNESIAEKIAKAARGRSNGT